jgi:hypothetical protein
MRRGGERCGICFTARIVSSRELLLMKAVFGGLVRKRTSAAEARTHLELLFAALKRRSSTFAGVIHRTACVSRTAGIPELSVSCESGGLGLLLQMFTHVSPVPFVSEQNRWKDAKMKLACSGWCVVAL